MKRRCARAALVAALVSAAAVSAEEPDVVTAALGEARAALAAGRPKDALERLRALGAAEDARVALLAGVAHYHAGEPAAAVARLSAVSERFPEGSVERKEAVQVLGLSLYLVGRLPEAIPLLEETREWAGDSLELAYALGMAYVQTRQADKARETWARSYALAPDSAAAHLVTAQMMVRAELDELAEAELRQALAKDQRLPRVRALLGQSALFRGRLDEAVALLEEEIRLSPGDAMAFFHLGDALSRQGRWDESLRALQRSAWLNPYFSGPYLLMGRDYLRRRDYGAAEGMLRRAIRHDPNNRAPHYLLGQLLQQTGRHEEARRELELAERLQESP